MNILADESVAAPIVAQLRQAGHDVQFITELAPGSSDATILARANQDDRLLLTADKDFGELVVRYGQVTTGVVLMRLDGLSLLEQARRVITAIAAYAIELPQAFTVITPGAVRLCPLLPPTIH